MKRSEKALKIQSILEQLYPEVPIPLDHTCAFTLLVAVVLSAQSTDKKVNEITPELFRAAPNAAAMAQLSVAEIKHLIRQIGLTTSKAKNLHGLANQIMERHEGEVPNTFEELEALPGVGHKTARVVMSQAFGVPAFPVDTHIHRLLYRWGLSTGKNVTQTEKDAKRLFPKERWNDLHLQIIWYGREYCPARGWDLSKDIITSTIGRASVLKAYDKRRSNSKSARK